MINTKRKTRKHHNSNQISKSNKNFNIAFKSLNNIYNSNKEILGDFTLQCQKFT